jgi:hypothetical protein
MTPGPLSFLRDTAAAHFAQAVDVGNDHVIFDVKPPSVSGAPSPTYRLRVDVVGDYAIIRELQPSLLPAYCPERHINIDGSFCLYWGEVEPLSISETKGAETWWMKVLIFLKRQQVARALRRWPAKAEARAHGPDAALQQLIAEDAASKLGPQFRTLLTDVRLTSVRSKTGSEPRLRLMLDGQRLVSVRERSRQLMTKRSRCKCDCADDLRLPICACGDHETVLTDITFARERLAKAETEFFRLYADSGRICCGTLEDCPLAA